MYVEMMPGEERTAWRSLGGAYLDIGSTVEHREHSIAVPTIFDLVKLTLLAMAMPRPWVSNACSGSSLRLRHSNPLP